MSRRLVTAASVAALAALTSCGGTGSPHDELAATAKRTGSVRSGILDLSMTVRAGGGGKDVGFTVRGPYSLPKEGGLPVADLTYSQLKGSGAPSTVRLISTGSAAYAVVDGKSRELTQQQTDALRQPGGNAFAGLHIDRWVTGATRQPGPTLDGAKTDSLAGAFDLVEAFTDLSSLVGDGGDPFGVASLSAADKDRLRKAVTASSATVVTTKDKHELRRLDARADLGKAAGAPSGLGNLLPVTLHLQLSLDGLGRPVSVQPPS